MMVEKEIFIDGVRDWLSAGSSKKEILEYIVSLGVSEKEAKGIIAEAEKGVLAKLNAIKASPGTMQKQITGFRQQKAALKKEKFKENINALKDIMARVQVDLKDSKEEPA